MILYNISFFAFWGESDRTPHQKKYKIN